MENATMEIVNVPFGNDVIPATIDENKTVWTVVSQICKNIGLTEKQRDAQVKKIQEDIVLKNGCNRFTLKIMGESSKFEGYKRDALCIKNDYLPLWLAKISITPTMQRDNPEATEKLVRYQLEAKDVLAEYFGFKEKEKLVPVTQSTQLTTTVPDSVASAMMMMQVNAINAFKESTTSLLSGFMEKELDSFNNILTYCKGVVDQNQILSTGLQKSYELIKDKNDQIDKLITVLINSNTNDDNITCASVDDKNNFELSKEKASWVSSIKKYWWDFTEKYGLDYKKSYSKIYDEMKNNQYINIDVNDYIEKAKSEFTFKENQYSKINICGYYEELHKPFLQALTNVVNREKEKAHTEENKTNIEENKISTSYSLKAMKIPEPFKTEAYKLVKCETIKNLQPYSYAELYKVFFHVSRIDRNNLIECICKKYNITNCSPAFAIYNHEVAWRKFKDFVGKEVKKCQQ